MPIPIPEEKCAEVIAKLKVNSNARQVASQIEGVSHASVWRIAKGAGIELTAGRAARGPPRVRQARVAAKLERALEKDRIKHAESAAANLRRALEKARMEGNRERIARLLAAADVEVLDKLRPAKAPPATAHLVSLSPGG